MPYIAINIVIWKPDGLPNTVIEDKDSYKSAGSVIITCKDNGAGLSADNLKDLFREGVQFNANVLQAGQGSGLGLCITKGIVELHQGSIHATSEGIGHGATFVVEIPVVNEINNRDVELGSERSCSSGETVGMGATKILPELERDASGVGGGGKERIPGDPSVNKKKNYVVKRKITNILVVDDVALNRKIVCRLMRGEGYVCFEAADGQECVDYMKRCQEGTQEPVDLILMDYEMPRMNGPTATEVLISSGILVPVIGITGNALKDDFEFFINHGALAVLTKPLAVPGLSVWIDKLNSECECECDTPSPPINMKTQGADGISLSVSKSQSKSNANVDKEGFEQCENFLS